MALAAVPLFYGWVEYYLDLGVFLFAIAVMAWAFIHAAMQRADAFSAVSSLRKNTWLGILGGLLVATLLFWFIGVLLIVMYIGIAAAAYYLLEVRRGIKDVSEGSW
ncbi:DUF2516 family protein [Allorhizocola rhizosphaerae]|uniref:DUF2516 family protein n=1 Tax=Allorhizocola rhizosphaerae TaxID=1872709 RepID=UPI000E3D441A|nr:DUF2516 family protein [Allorhizocola rhizosphaerae]